MFHARNLRPGALPWAVGSWRKHLLMRERIVSGMMRVENLATPHLPWQERLDAVMEMMRELSSQTDPQQMVQQYAPDAPVPARRPVALARAAATSTLSAVRVTRYSGWNSEVNPWKEPQKLPILTGGS